MDSSTRQVTQDGVAVATRACRNRSVGLGLGGTEGGQCHGVTCRISQITLDVQDVERMAQFWSAVLGYTTERLDDGSILLNPPSGGEPTVWLQTGATQKVGKLRCHIDLRTSEPESEVERLLSLGAARADVGQRGDEGFEVLSDPEGNEFCVLHRTDPP
jgi:catechol 2,3-dioxygenase-like lactoylglutathione lyase family enzyme